MNNPSYSYFVVIAFAISSFSLNAQTVYFRNEIQIPSDMPIQAKHVATFDGGSVVLLNSYDTLTGFYFATVTKLNPNGQITWYKRFGPGALNTENIVQCPDSGYFFCAREITSPGQVAIKLDKNGNTVFSKELTPPSQYYTGSVSIAFARNNGTYYIAGNLSDINTGLYYWHIVSLDANGNVLWSKGYNPTLGKSYCFDADTFSNGDIGILGTTYDPQNGLHTPAVARIDASGNLIWMNAYKHAQDDLSSHNFEISGSDHVYIASQHFNMTNFTYTTVVTKTNGAGNITWSFKYGVGNTAYHMKLVEDPYFVVTGENFMMKIDTTGLPLCGRIYYGFYVTTIDTIGSVYSYAGLAGASYNAIIMTSDPNGETCNDAPLSVSKTPITLIDSALIGSTVIPLMVTLFNLPLAFTDIHSTEICTAVGIEEGIAGENGIDIYPSPASNVLNITGANQIESIRIISMKGEEVMSVNPQATFAEIDVSGLSNGMYLVVMQGADFISSEKIIIEKQ